MEQLVSFKTAQKAKDKGFNIVCDYLVTTFDKQDVNLTCLRLDTYYKNKEISILAPSQSVLAKWLREEHNIRVLVDFETIDDTQTAYVWNIVQDLPEGKGRKKDTWDFYERSSSFSAERMGWYEEFEEAFEAGLFEALNLLEDVNT